METGRNSHTATLLADGRLLIVGGRDAKHRALASAEIYDPVDGLFTPVSPLGNARHGHQATLLGNGNVLVTGGGADAEFFSPASGIWTVTQPGDGIPGGDSATLLGSGQVLVIGGVDGSQGGISRLFDPTTNQWARTGSLALARRNPTATRLADGRVLVCGGSDYGTGGIVGAAEIYDPTTGIWSGAGAMNSARNRHTATLLADGRVLVCGGNNRDALASNEIYDPASGTWTSANPLSISRENHTAILLPDNRVMVCGGVPAASTVLATTEIFDPASGQWSPGDTLASSRCLHAMTRLENGDLLITGGWGAYNRPSPGDFSLAIRDVEEYGPPVPEIVLFQEKTHLASGESVAFGSVTRGAESVRKFTLRNAGSADLSGLRLAIAGASAFTAIPGALPTTLAARSSIPFSVRFSPDLAGPASASLVIESNDANEGTFTIALSGTGTESGRPEIAVELSGKPELIDGKGQCGYGPVALGASRSLTFTIRNVGTADLTGISIRKGGRDKQDFTIGYLAKTTLKPGGKTPIRITFNPGSTGPRTANLRILSNDADEGSFDIGLTGKGTGR